MRDTVDAYDLVAAPAPRTVTRGPAPHRGATHGGASARRPRPPSTHRVPHGVNGGVNGPRAIGAPGPRHDTGLVAHQRARRAPRPTDRQTDGAATGPCICSLIQCSDSGIRLM
ncbi:hypothetical protein SNOUR_06315 [Streptomyces noursei ATCC 11455]|nr:hypothetical protein SNOUR_06315 [Streptomyces noursei ATCC 11455]